MRAVAPVDALKSFCCRRAEPYRSERVHWASSPTHVGNRLLPTQVGSLHIHFVSPYRQEILERKTRSLAERCVA